MNQKIILVTLTFLYSTVKVYASWCKTCAVFDIRYRKLASQFGDTYNDDTTAMKEQYGRARFAEMQYDDPNNEEMCKLLNATKLPYILLYKGSKGKVKEFQCSPSKFQLLIDAVNEFADPAFDDEESAARVVANGNSTEVIAEMGNIAALTGDDLAASPNSTTVVSAFLETEQDFSLKEEDTIDSLKQQLEQETAEKVEMFEIMKAQIEHDKGYIQKLEAGVETQRIMLEEKDEEISKLQTTIKSNEKEVQSLSANFTQQEEITQQAKQELDMHKAQVSQLTNRISQVERSITSIELESSYNEKTAQEKERRLLQQMKKWNEQKNVYEKERNSLRQLALLAFKRIGRGTRNLATRIRGKNRNRN